MYKLHIACHPHRSVIVQACAGSGKTWLLVARMLRILLSGAPPESLLAITFTRKAAQEMRERLFTLLEDCALQPEAQVKRLLMERGVEQAALPEMLPAAREVFERVLSCPQGIAIETFHSWFARLIQIAPLASGCPQGYQLTENPQTLLTQAWQRWMQSLDVASDRAPHGTRHALLTLYDKVGFSATERLLYGFIHQRTEWQSLGEVPITQALALLRAHLGNDAIQDPIAPLWESSHPCRRRIQTIAQLLGKGSALNQQRATAIETALTDRDFSALYQAFLDEKGVARKNKRTKALSVILASYQASVAFGTFDFDIEFNAIADELLYLKKRSEESDVLAMNEAFFLAGSAFLDHYDQCKQESRTLDFTDLERYAWQLLTHPQCAAYMHNRLDARYQHILLDEFQDTNPVQWRILRAWLAAYGGEDKDPSLFVVGDPKQSIFRFRRAEPRVFEATTAFLQKKGAIVVQMNTTRRNARAIVATINQSFIENPLFSSHSTLSEEEGDVWRLPLITTSSDHQSKSVICEPDVPLRNPLTTSRKENQDMRRYAEGEQVAEVLWYAKKTLLFEWSEVMLLAKKRVHWIAYETALQAASIPFISDRRGGLLHTLEITDLIALLSVLNMPSDNLALAQVLKSPVFQWDDAALMGLAQQAADHHSWWACLQEKGEHPAQQLLSWQKCAQRLPVHDLLDVILHEGDIFRQYRLAMNTMEYPRVRHNIDTFMALTLHLDTSCYPGLSKFLFALQQWQAAQTDDAPDEAHLHLGENTLRLMTIHSAKGLEAPVVVLLDSNHSHSPREEMGILCDWPEEYTCPVHFSAFANQCKGVAREALFVTENHFRQQEDWNLLYVGATRAKQLLIISGIANASDDVTLGSWYDKFRQVPVWAMSK